MKKEITLDEFKIFISEHLGVNPGDLNKDTSFMDDLGIDSLSLINLVVRMEKKFNIRIKLEHIWEFSDVGTAYNALIKRN